MSFKIFTTTILLVVILIKAGNAQQAQAYPRVTGYFSVYNMMATLSGGSVTSNFSNVYTVNMPFGMNLLKSDHFGISFEVSPAIRTENNISKISSIALSPGAMFRFANGFTIIQRFAFETSGRFGTSTVFHKILIRGRDASFFGAVPFPVRFGNGTPVSVATGLQFGVAF